MRDDRLADHGGVWCVLFYGKLYGWFRRVRERLVPLSRNGDVRVTNDDPNKILQVKMGDHVSCMGMDLMYIYCVANASSTTTSI